MADGLRKAMVYLGLADAVEQEETQATQAEPRSQVLLPSALQKPHARRLSHGRLHRNHKLENQRRNTVLRSPQSSVPLQYGMRIPNCVRLLPSTLVLTTMPRSSVRTSVTASR